MSIIKQSIHHISEPLTHIINLSIYHGIVPDEMKIARVIPVFKSDDQSLITNYRPISVLPSFSKFLERIIYNRLVHYLQSFNILCDNQYGFRKDHSTSLAIIDSRCKMYLLAHFGNFTTHNSQKTIKISNFHVKIQQNPKFSPKFQQIPNNQQNEI